MENFKVEKHPQEIAEALYEQAKDMDYMDYEDEKEQVLADLEKALYDLMAICQNEYNHKYYSTLYRVLERI